MTEHGWGPYWRHMANLRWGALDQHVLEVVGDAMGFGPGRSLLEIGAGRGLHTCALYHACRCGLACVVDSDPGACEMARRLGLGMEMSVAEIPNGSHDVVWSSGVVEHALSDPERQAIIDEHFRLARELVVVVVPRETWTRRLLCPPSPETPSALMYSERELLRRMGRHGWHVKVSSFAPLFGFRHIPDAFYSVLTKLIGWALPDNLLMGVARRC